MFHVGRAVLRSTPSVDCFIIAIAISQISERRTHHVPDMSWCSFRWLRRGRRTGVRYSLQRQLQIRQTSHKREVWWPGRTLRALSLELVPVTSCDDDPPESFHGRSRSTAHGAFSRMLRNWTLSDPQLCRPIVPFRKVVSSASSRCCSSRSICSFPPSIVIFSRCHLPGW